MSRSPADSRQGNPGLRMQAGMGLIEVLIAVLVLAIGILGVAALQARALANNSSSIGRSMATIASYSILDALRADRSNALAGNYNTTTPLEADNCSTGTGLVTNQLYNWCTHLRTMLGAAKTTTGKIDCDTSGNCTIIVTYDDSNVGGSGAAGGSSAQSLITVASL